MNNIFLIGLNNIAPTELNQSVNQSSYYDTAPTELMQKNPYTDTPILKGGDKDFFFLGR